MLRSYYLLLYKRALAEAMASIGLTRQTLQRLLLVSTAGVVISRLVIGWDSAVTTALSVLVGVILANLVVLLGAFIVQLVRSPALIHSEQERTIGGLTARRATADAAERLSQQDEYAVHRFWARPPDGSNEEVVDNWIAELEHWADETEEIMLECGCTSVERRSFRVLGNLAEFAPTGGARHHGHGRINTALVRLDGRRKRLAAVIRKYTDD